MNKKETGKQKLLTAIKQHPDKSNSRFIKQQLKKAPYSSVIQNLATADSESSLNPIFRIQANGIQFNSEPSEKEQLNPKSKRTRKTRIKKESKKTEPKQKRVKKPKQIKSKSIEESNNSLIQKQDEVRSLSIYTQWINTLEQEKNWEELSMSKKKKLKSKKKKSILKQKIDNSLKVKEEIATEALAKLYVSQGYYKNAIKVYKKLSLKNPEKSAFFAPLIKEIKKKIK